MFSALQKFLSGLARLGEALHATAETLEQTNQGARDRLGLGVREVTPTLLPEPPKQEETPEKKSRKKAV